MKKNKVDMSVEDARPPIESSVIEVDPLQSKKRKRSESGKKRRNVPLILERLVIPSVGDPQAPAVGEDAEGLLVPEKSEEEHLERCFMEFPT